MLQVLSFWLIFVGVLGLWLGFPNTVYHIPALAVLYPLSLYILGAKAKGCVDALRKGWIAGLLGSSATLYWLSIPIHNVGGLPWPLAVPCALAIGAYVGLYGGIFSLISYIFKRYMSALPRCIALACAWYGLELIRGSILTGFPWLPISAAFVPWPIMLQGASIIGGYALSGLYVGATLLLFESITNNTNRLHLACMGWGILLAPIVFGFYVLNKNPIVTHNSGQDPSFILVEGNVDQNIKWEPHLQNASLELYKGLTEEAVQILRKENPRAKAIVVWPETAMPFYLEHHPVLSQKLAQFVKNINFPLIVGAPGMLVQNKDQRQIFNRAYLINASGQLTNFYDKKHLVPFGEYVPWWLKISFLDDLLQGIGNFTQGKQTKPLIINKLALGMLICYESIFPELARTQVEHGANILLNISNDGWFGDSSAPEQHLQLAMVRAIEQGRWLVRNTNTGISAIVDSYGRLILKGEQFKAQSLIGFAKPLEKHTIFFYIGPWLPYVILGIFLIAFILGKRKIRP